MRHDMPLSIFLYHVVQLLLPQPEDLPYKVYLQAQIIVILLYVIFQNDFRLFVHLLISNFLLLNHRIANLGLLGHIYITLHLTAFVS